jgi:hypothetical protein
MSAGVYSAFRVSTSALFSPSLMFLGTRLVDFATMSQMGHLAEEKAEGTCFRLLVGRALPS